jgi:uncharacterized membrane protein
MFSVLHTAVCEAGIYNEQATKSYLLAVFAELIAQIACVIWFSSPWSSTEY